MKHDLTNDEVVAALNAELERMGFLYRATDPISRATETDNAILKAVDEEVAAHGRPARNKALYDRTGLPRGTVDSATKRLAHHGVLVGTSALGYMRRTG